MVPHERAKEKRRRQEGSVPRNGSKACEIHPQKSSDEEKAYTETS
jgi:hypothetical protein